MKILKHTAAFNRLSRINDQLCAVSEVFIVCMRARFLRALLFSVMSPLLALGFDVRLFSAIGKDEFGAFLRRKLSEEDMKLDPTVVSLDCATCACIVLSGALQYLFMVDTVCHAGGADDCFENVSTPGVLPFEQTKGMKRPRGPRFEKL